MITRILFVALNVVAIVGIVAIAVLLAVAIFAAFILPIWNTQFGQ